jgi:hypothetical protein
MSIRLDEIEPAVAFVIASGDSHRTSGSRRSASIGDVLKPPLASVAIEPARCIRLSRFPGTDHPSVAEVEVETSVTIHIQDRDSSSHDLRKMMLVPRPGPVPKVDCRPGLNLMENDGGTGLGRGLTGAATVRIAIRDGK